MSRLFEVGNAKLRSRFRTLYGRVLSDDARRCTQITRGIGFQSRCHLFKSNHTLSKPMAFVVPTSVPTRSQPSGRSACRSRHRVCIFRPRTPRLHLRAKPTVQSALEPLVLSEDAVQQALVEVEEKLGSVFGTSAENRNVGITGRVEGWVDGPNVVLRLTGRFWHKRSDVFARVSAYLLERIPEICEIEIESAEQLDDADPPSK